MRVEEVVLPGNDPETETGARRGPAATELFCIGLALLGLASCAGPQIQPAVAISAASPSGVVDAARKQEWNCPRIRQTIANLIPRMLATKARAEQEQAQTAQTLTRMLARYSGPPGSGNTALAAFQNTRRDADQLNDLLREKGCATYPVGVDAPAFLKPL
jgi:hypothetical protein